MNIHDKATTTLAMWEIQSAGKDFPQRIKERGDEIAANLRGTIKNNQATHGMIASLESDLAWCLGKAAGTI